MKITIIGSGSSYTPLFFNYVVENLEILPVAEIALFDISSENLETTWNFMGNLLAESGKSLKLTKSARLEDALYGADFVLTQIRVGGMEARKKDILLGLESDLVGQETTGIGGFANALRTIPEILHISEMMRKHSSENAWLINFTNPAGIITEAVLRHTKIKAVGICNCSVSMVDDISVLTKIPAEELEYDYAGANHLAGIIRLEHEGKDILEHTIDLLAESELGGMKNVPDFEIPAEFMKKNGYIPVSYLKYFWFADRIITYLKSQKKTRADVLIELDKKVKNYYRKKNSFVIPEEMELRGGAGYNTIAFMVIAALAGFGDRRLSVIGRNRSSLSAFHSDTVLELPSVIKKDSITPEIIGSLPDSLNSLVAGVKEYEYLTVEAAVSGDRTAALRAMSFNPLIDRGTGNGRLFEKLVEYNREYLGEWS